MDKSAPKTARTSLNEPEDCRRRFVRITPDWLQCDAGEIVDISLGGAMLKCTRRLKGSQAMRIWNAEKGLILQAEIVWANPICFRHHEIGVRWIRLGEENLDTLSELIFPYGMPDEDEVVGLAPPELKLTEEDGTEVVPSRSPHFEDEEEEMLTIDDRNLRYLVDTWPHLSEDLRQGILRMVRKL